MFESGGTDQEDKIMAPGDKFYWTLNDKTYEANQAFFSAHLGPNATWDIIGASGRIVDGNLFQFSISIPYEGEVLIEKTYKLGEDKGFRVSHFHSPPPPELEPVSTSADDAELTIRLDPINGIATGDFNANFFRGGYRLKPEGTFKVTRLSADK